MTFQEPGGIGRVQMAEALIAARHLNKERAQDGRHHVTAAVISHSGKIYTALNLENTLDRAAICAEAVAVGMAAAAERDVRIVFCIAVNRRLEVIPPCGLCRELLLDFGPDAVIGIPDGDAEFATMALRDPRCPAL